MMLFESQAGKDLPLVTTTGTPWQSNSGKSWVDTHIKKGDMRQFIRKHMPAEWMFYNVLKDGVETTSAGVELTGADTTTPWMTPNDADPQPIQSWYTPARYFARELVKADTSLLGNTNKLCKGIVERLNKVGIKKRGGVKQFDQSTIKKALTGISYG